MYTLGVRAMAGGYIVDAGLVDTRHTCILIVNKSEEILCQK